MCASKAARTAADSGSVLISRESLPCHSRRHLGYIGARSNLLGAHARGRLLIMTDIPSDVESDTAARAGPPPMPKVH